MSWRMWKVGRRQRPLFRHEKKKTKTKQGTREDDFYTDEEEESALISESRDETSHPKDKVPRRRSRRRMTYFVLSLMVMGLGAYYLLGVSYTGGGSFGYPLNFNTSIIHTWIKSAINGGGVGEGDASMPRGAGCNFPRLTPLPAEIREFIKEPDPVDCLLNHTLRFRSNLHNQLIPVDGVNLEVKGETCCYKAFQREHSSDNVRYSSLCYPVSLTKATDIPPYHEFVSVECIQGPENDSASDPIPAIPTHKDMFAFVNVKPRVENRIVVTNIANGPHSGHDDRLSVVILGLDAQSHMNFLRQFPLSREFLVANLSATSLQGYNSVGYSTFPNLVPLLTGLSEEQLATTCWPDHDTYFDSCPFIWKSFASAGYRTSFAEDAVWMGAFHYIRKGFRVQPTDYYLHPCAIAMEGEIRHQTVCYGPRLGFEVLLDYMVKTAGAFDDSKTERKHYFQFIWATSLFHDYPNMAGLGDQLLLERLQKLKLNHWLNNTLLIVMSDHGARWGGIRDTYQGSVEERMPFAYLSFPTWFTNKYSDEMKALEGNARDRLTTPFDIHTTLRHILEIDKGVRSWTEEGGVGQSLLAPIPKERGCFEAGVDGHWCVCDKWAAFRNDSSIVKEAATFLLKDGINKKLRLWRKICAQRSLDWVKGAMVQNMESNEEDTPVLDGNTTNLINKRIGLRLTLVTAPGGGVFEATVHGELSEIFGWRWKMAGGISRLDLYKEESWCVGDKDGKKYCYCKVKNPENKWW